MKLKQHLKQWLQNILYKGYEKAGGRYRGPILGVDLQKVSVELKLDRQIYGGLNTVVVDLLSAALLKEGMVDVKEYHGDFDKLPWGKTSIIGTVYVLPPNKVDDYMPKSRIYESRPQ